MRSATRSAAARVVPRAHEEAKPPLIDSTGLKVLPRVQTAPRGLAFYFALAAGLSLAGRFLPPIPLPAPLVRPAATLHRILSIAVAESSAPALAAARPEGIPAELLEAARAWGEIHTIRNWTATGLWVHPGRTPPSAGTPALGLGGSGLGLVGIVAGSGGAASRGKEIFVEDLFARGEGLGVRVEGGASNAILERREGRLILTNLPPESVLPPGAQVVTVGGKVPPDLPVGRLGARRTRAGLDIEAEVMPNVEITRCRFVVFSR